MQSQVCTHANYDQLMLDRSVYSQFQVARPIAKNEKYILTNQMQAMYTEFHRQEYDKFDWSVWVYIFLQWGKKPEIVCIRVSYDQLMSNCSTHQGSSPAMPLAGHVV